MNEQTRIRRLEDAFAKEHDYSFDEGDMAKATHGTHTPSLESGRMRYFATAADVTAATGQYVDELVYCLETMQLYRCTALPSTWSAVGPGFGIVESGSNSNGSYIKFSDRTMICWGNSAASVTTTNANGNVFYKSATVTFPAEFVGADPTVISRVTQNDSLTWPGMRSGVTLTTAVLYIIGSQNVCSGYLGYVAIGEW